MVVAGLGDLGGLRMSKIYEIADGSFLEKQSFIDSFKELLDKYLVLKEMMNVVKEQQGQANTLKNRIRKGTDEQEQKKNAEALLELQMKLDESVMKLNQIEEDFITLRAKLIPKAYHNDFATRSICFLIANEIEFSIKDALKHVHKAEHEMKIAEIHYAYQIYDENNIARLRRKAYDLEKELSNMDRSIQNVKSQLNTYLIQNNQNEKEARESLISAWIVDISR